jgi:hypothetical protein
MHEFGDMRWGAHPKTVDPFTTTAADSIKVEEK